MSERLDDLYLTWLYSKIGSVRYKNIKKTHWCLARQMYSKEFIWFVPNDDNRCEDGKDLRYEFIRERHLRDVDPEWMSLPCSMLELFVALSHRLSFEDLEEATPREWFWQLMQNIDLDECTDLNYDELHAMKVDKVLDRVIWRTYKPNGHGGLFPLKHPRQDQRDVELWYQLCAYIQE